MTTYFAAKEILEVLKNEGAVLFQSSTTYGYYYYVTLGDKRYNMKKATFNVVLKSLDVKEIEYSSNEFKTTSKYFI